jgi:hypothetical protein
MVILFTPGASLIIREVLTLRVIPSVNFVELYGCVDGGGGGGCYKLLLLLCSSISCEFFVLLLHVAHQLPYHPL